jgi:tetratricopeptide (TPR) repeat protein
MNMPINKTAMNTANTEQVFTDIEKAIGPYEKSLVSCYPWASTYRIENTEQTYYLKLIQPHNRHAIINSQLISQYFQEHSAEIVLINPETGVLLFRDHCGIPLQQHPSAFQLRHLLHCYAAIQVSASKISELKEKIQTLSAKNILDHFMAFLNPQSDFVTENPGSVNATFFITPEEAQNYHLALQRRLPLLEKLLHKADALPDTLNHGDLHMQNAAETAQGEMLLIDWDDAVIAPAGLSLHLPFNGCSNIFRLLDNENELTEELLPYQQPLRTYIQTLVNGGYSDQHTLTESLPATACAGTMYSLSCYAHYPLDDWFYKEDIGRIFRERLEDLVALCDLLALQSRDSVVFFANDYSQSGAPWRAAFLVNQYLNKHPNDIELHQFAAQLNLYMGRWPEAIFNCQAVLQARPDDADAYARLGNALLKNQQPELAVRELENALAIDPDHQEAKAFLDKSVYILQCRDRARIPHLAPTIRQFAHEMQNNTVDIENLDLATAMFREHGYVVIEDLFPVELMQQISALVMKKYDTYFEDRKYEDNLVLGDKRRMVTLEIEGPVNTPALYGNAMIDGLMQRLLSDDYVMGGLNAVVSLPKSRDQGLHKDYSPLFRGEPVENHVTPPFAVAMLTPLINMTREHGVTSFRKGSHRVPEQMPYHIPTQEPLLRMGDTVVFDYRTAHEGLANHTDEVRPLLCIIFHRIWFRDALNYNQQKDVAISKDELKKVPENLQHLFKWTAK